MTDHLTGWRLSAGDEHTIFDGRNYKLAVIPCGGMAGRTFKESTECAAHIVHCVNTHDALVKALEGLAAATEEYLTTGSDRAGLSAMINGMRKGVESARAALALAKGEGNERHPHNHH